MRDVDAVFYFPIDFSWIVRRVFDRVRPRLLVLMEGEIWPNVLRECTRRDVKTLVVNGRVYLPNQNNEVAVYGLLGAPTPTATATTAGTPTATPVGSVDLALNKSATASSAETAGTTANLAVDGNTTTRWGSAFTDPQWIMVDLGATTFITRVRLNWEAAYGKTYQIQTSNDNATWTTVVTVTVPVLVTRIEYEITSPAASTRKGGVVSASTELTVFSIVNAVLLPWSVLVCTSSSVRTRPRRWSARPSSSSS